MHLTTKLNTLNNIRSWHVMYIIFNSLNLSVTTQFSIKSLGFQKWSCEWPRTTAHVTVHIFQQKYFFLFPPFLFHSTPILPLSVWWKPAFSQNHSYAKQNFVFLHSQPFNTIPSPPSPQPLVISCFLYYSFPSTSSHFFPLNQNI